MEITKELLFVGSFILVVVLFIQYLSYSKLKKMVKPTRKSRYVNNTGANINHAQHEVNHAMGVPQVVRANQQQNHLLNIDDIEIDTPDEDADSYVNPVHSEKHIDDDEIEEK